MSVMTTLQVPGKWTYADLEGLPDDGHRYEIIDGVLLVNASPIPDHQEVTLNLWSLLDQAAPSDLRVLAAPLDVVLANDTVVEPDVLVARRADYSEKNLPAVPLLAVEVLSPSTRSVDMTMKKHRYERAGIASYWVIDPKTLQLTVFELRDAAYALAAEVGPDETWTATLPYSVTLSPRNLLKR